MKEIAVLIEEIDNIFIDFCGKISSYHHKHKDGIWNMYHDIWSEKWYIYHHGYILDDVDVENEDLVEALKEFKEKIKERINQNLHTLVP